MLATQGIKSHLLCFQGKIRSLHQMARFKFRSKINHNNQSLRKKKNDSPDLLVEKDSESDKSKAVKIEKEKTSNRIKTSESRLNSPSVLKKES